MTNENSSADDETVAIESLDESGAAQTSVDTVRTTPGSLLLAQRETLELSLQHVADELNLTMHYVRALETDSYEKLPGDVFVKGYIRSYARLLGLDPEQVLDIYREFTTHKLARKEEAIKRHARRRMDKNRPWIIFSGIAFVVVALLLWLMSSFNDSDTPVAESERGVAGAIGSAGNIDALPVFDATSSDDEAAALAADSGGSTGTDESGIAAAADGQSASISWPGEDSLQLDFTADSGVEIEHRGGDERHSEMHLAGERLIIQGTAPFSILLENAPGVRLGFNGRPIDFTSNIKSDNSVRLNIGL